MYGRYSVRKFLSDEFRVYRSGDPKIGGSRRQHCKKGLVRHGVVGRGLIANEGLTQRDLRVHACHEAVVVPRL